MIPSTAAATKLRAGVVWRRDADDPGYLFDSETGGLFALNRSGATLVSRMGASGAGLADLAAALVARFEVDPETALRDVRDFLHQLSENGLVATG